MLTETYSEFEDLYKFQRKGLSNLLNINVTLNDKQFEVVYKIAKIRRDTHIRHNSTTVYCDDYEEVGVIGELAFEILTGYPMDRTSRKKGDLYDFYINNYYIDVKTTRTNSLKVKHHRLFNNFIYVLAGGDLENKKVSFYGWCFGAFIKEHGCYVNKRYILDKTHLAKMESLEYLLDIKYRTVQGERFWI